MVDWRIGALMNKEVKPTYFPITRISAIEAKLPFYILAAS
jgi:hypothetical protein